MARELSIFADESGDRDGSSRYYLLTLVFHDQSKSILNVIETYENSLRMADLPNIPFHSEPLLNGHGDYEYLSIFTRKKLLIGFGAMLRHLPISYKTFAYKRNEIESASLLSARMKRDISGTIFDNLEFFQSFDEIKVYYDNGQDIVKQALDQSMDFALSKNTVERRRTSMIDYRLEQVADYLCTIELAAIKYSTGENGATYDKFFGQIGSFKRNWLKQARRKRLD